MKDDFQKRNETRILRSGCGFSCGKSFDQKSGARKIRKVISEWVEDAIAGEILRVKRHEKRNGFPHRKSRKAGRNRDSGNKRDQKKEENE